MTMINNVDELLLQHRAAIKELRNALSDIHLPVGYDDIRLLRYTLSYPKTAQAAEQVRKSVRFRKENEDWLGGAWTGKAPPHDDEVNASCKMGVHGEHDGVIYLYMRSGKAVRRLRDMPAKELGPLCERVVRFLTFVKETIFARCEALTRSTRILTKFVNVHTDMSEFPYWANMNFIRMFKETSLHSTFLHPQLMHKQVVLDPPKVFFLVWRIAKPILPKKTVDRMQFCNQNEFLTSIVGNRLDRSQVPRLAGGSCNCREGDCLNRFKI